MLVKSIAILLFAFHLIFSATQYAAAQPAATSTVPAAGSPVAAIPSFMLDPETPFERFEVFLLPLGEEDLAALAAHWHGLLKAHLLKMSEQHLQLKESDKEAKTENRAEWSRLADQRIDLFAKFDAVLAAWKEKSGDPEMIKKYRRYETAVLARGVKEMDTIALSARVFNWLVDPNGGIALAINLAAFVASCIGVIAIAAGARRFARNRLRRLRNVSKLLKTFLVGAVYWIVAAIGLVVALDALGIDVTPIFAIFGGASFILAFAFQDTLGNLASGLMIMVNRPFDEGDYVDIAGVSGTVKAVSIVATTVLTPDNRVIVIPNRNVWSSVITNATISATRRVDLKFSISYEDSIADAIAVMKKTVASHPLVLAEPEPVIEVSELSESSVNFICRPWAKTMDYWSVYWDLMRKMKEAFDAAGISIPYPQRDIHIRSNPSQ